MSWTFSLLFSQTLFPAILHLTHCTLTMLGCFLYFWKCPRAFALALSSSWNILPPKYSHSWFLLISSWICQLKCQFFKKTLSSPLAKTHQSLPILLPYFLYDTHTFWSYLIHLFMSTDCFLPQSVSPTRAETASYSVST